MYGYRGSCEVLLDVYGYRGSCEVFPDVYGYRGRDEGGHGGCHEVHAVVAEDGDSRDVLDARARTLHNAPLLLVVTCRSSRGQVEVGVTRSSGGRRDMVKWRSA